MRSLTRRARQLAGAWARYGLRRGGYHLSTEREYLDLIRQLHDTYVRTHLEGLPPAANRIESLAALRGTPAGQALHLIAGIHETRPLPGGVCEFGVAQGFTSALLANELKEAGDRRRLWLYDSFEGLPAPTEEDQMIGDAFSLGSMADYEGAMAHPETEVVHRLRRIGFRNAQLVPGFITDETPADVLPPSISFAYIDLDFYKPILNTLLLVDQRADVGARIYVDDFGAFSTGGKQAVEEFVAQMGSRYTFAPGDEAVGHFAALQRV